MTDSSANRSVSFNCQQRAYGAFDLDTEKLLLVVEAKDEEEARSCIAVVAPYLGIARSKVLIVIELEAMPSGVPTFFSQFFLAGKISINRADVVPGSSTLQ
jgi:hypothetical protein